MVKNKILLVYYQLFNFICVGPMRNYFTETKKFTMFTRYSICDCFFFTFVCILLHPKVKQNKQILLKQYRLYDK